ncbi:hypothetical protein D3C80_1642870 [compost metagenome]
MIAIKYLARFEPHGCPLLINLISRLHVHINSNTKDHVTHISRISYQLQQYPGDLFLTDQDIVRPFQPNTWNTQLAQCLHNGKPNNQT